MKARAAPGYAAWILIAGSATTGILLSQAPRPIPERQEQPPGEWRSAGRDNALTRFSPLDQINRETVGRLQPVWSFETGAAGPHEGNPLVVGTTLFIHTPYPNQVMALDLTRPESPVKWRYAAPLPGPRPGRPARPGTPPLPMPTGCCDVGSRGLAYHESGKLYVPILSGELAALDARTGREIWRVRNSDWRSGATLAGAPLVAGNLVLVGVSGAENGVRGYLTAYDAMNGRLVWRGWSTGPDSTILLDGPANPVYSTHRNRDLGVSTWTGGSGWQWGGGTPSGWLSFDPALDLVFYGTDQPAPANPAARPGDNKWTSSIFARELATGRVRWILQLTPHDQWGYGAANENILADLIIGAEPVKALVHFDRNGFVYTIDRATGKLLTAERFGPVNWSRLIDQASGLPVLDPRYRAPGGTAKTADICPASIGMKFFQPAAYSPQTSLFFVPANNLCMDMEIRPGGSDVAVTAKAGPGNTRGRFLAWNAATAALVWENREPLGVAGGALATAGGLVFYGTLDGWLKALDQTSGRELWKYRTPSGIVGNPIAFLGPDGKEYIAVLSGLGGWWGLGGNGAFPELAGTGSPTGVLTVFGW
jgi:PQQ-dependent dehydrogenase (methanol/ethanol family)